MTDFSFLSPLPLVQPLPNITPQSSPLKNISNPPPLITLDDYSANYNLQNFSAKDQFEPLAPPETPLTGAFFLHHPNYSTSSNSDSERIYPPSSGMPSEASSAVASESDLPSAVASEPDLPSTMVTESNILVQSHLQPSEPKKQTGIYDFFRALFADEIQLVRAKRKRANSEEEEADRVVRRQKEQQQKEKKADAR